jgi:hypothetical protein
LLLFGARTIGFPLKKHQGDAVMAQWNFFPDELPFIPVKKGLHPVAPHSSHG